MGFDESRGQEGRSEKSPDLSGWTCGSWGMLQRAVDL